MTPVEQHLADLERDRYSDSTVSIRRRVLATIDDPLNMDREKTQAWWQTRQTKPDGTPRAASSLSSEGAHAREFWRWAMRQGLMERNPADWLPKVRQKKTMAVVVPEGDLYTAMKDAEPPMRRMLALASMAGLRSAEIGVVKWTDIDRTNGVLWVREGKGGKDRSVPLSSGLLAELGDPEPVGLIIGRQMSPKAVSMAVGRYLRAHGSDYTAHKLRARYATRFLAATGDVVAAAEVLGHADLSSITRYAVASSDTMRRGAEAAGRIG
jgi:integrase/recombinase XerC